MKTVIHEIVKTVAAVLFWTLTLQTRKAKAMAGFAVLAMTFLVGTSVVLMGDAAYGAFRVLMRPSDQVEFSKFAKNELKKSIDLTEAEWDGTMVSVRVIYNDGYTEASVCAGPEGEERAFRDPSLNHCGFARAKGDDLSYGQVAHLVSQATGKIYSIYVE